MLYNKATSVDPKSYQAWHQWGLANYRAIEELRIDNASNSKGTSTANSLGLGYKLGLHSPRVSLNNSSLGLPKQHTIPKDVLVPLATNAIKGLLKALSLGTRRNTASVMQDMLCILSVWFRYSSINEVCSTVEQGLARVHLDNFLGVLPQVHSLTHSLTYSLTHLLTHSLSLLRASITKNLTVRSSCMTC